MGNMNVALYLIYLRVNIYEKVFYQGYKFIIVYYCVSTVANLNYNM